MRFDQVLEHENVVFILLDRRLDSFPVIFWIQSFPAVILVTDFRAVAFGLDDVDLEEAIDEEMIDLSDAIVQFNPEVVNDRPVRRILKDEINVVSRLFFPFLAGSLHIERLLEAEAFPGIARLLNTRLQSTDVRLFGILLLEHHS